MKNDDLLRTYPVMLAAFFAALPEKDAARFDRAAMSMLWSAAGDALGFQVEFSHMEEIRKTWRTGLVDDFRRSHRISDDTQMALAVARALTRTSASTKTAQADEAAALARLFCADEFLRWQAEPQGGPRAPGGACMSALSNLRGSGKLGQNTAKSSGGCGAIMRAHPVGLWAQSPIEALKLGWAQGAITHGHHRGNAPAAVLAYLIAVLCSGVESADPLSPDRLLNIVRSGLMLLVEAGLLSYEDGEEHDVLYSAAVRKSGTRGDLEWMNRVQGWAGHDALAIALHAIACGHVRGSVLDILPIAVSHNGDSDSTGCVAGAIVGAVLPDLADVYTPESYFSVEFAPEVVISGLLLETLRRRDAGLGGSATPLLNLLAQQAKDWKRVDAEVASEEIDLEHEGIAREMHTHIGSAIYRSDEAPPA